GWDASQVYGETEQQICDLRTGPKRRSADGELCPGGKLYVKDDGFLPADPVTGRTISGFTDNWWLGLEVLHTLFAKEHNSICDHLKKNERQLSEDEIFEAARRINCAIMAKIHSVEWTPAILDHSAIQPSLDATWQGIISQYS